MLHLSYGFINHLLIVFPLLRVEVRGTGFLLHPPIRQLGKVKGEMCSSLSILTEAFQRGKTGNIEGGSLTEFLSHGGKLTNFGDNFCCTAWLFLGLSNLWRAWLRCPNVG